MPELREQQKAMVQQVVGVSDVGSLAGGVSGWLAGISKGLQLLGEHNSW